MQEAVITLDDVMEMSAELSPSDQLRLVAGLTDRLSREWSRMSAPSQGIAPNMAVKRAINLYNEGTITLGRAAEMADVTRWELQRILQARGAPLLVEVPPTEQMDRDLARYLA